MRENNISVGIDIGNTKVITCVGKVEGNTVDVIAVGKSVNQGVRKGVVVDVEETVSAITASLEEAERMAGFQIQSASISISGPFIESEQSKGVIAIGRQDGEITPEDAIRALEAAKSIPNKPNREILHVLPQSYIIDSNEVVKDPIGMTGIRLEVMANIITASSNAEKSLFRATGQAELAIDNLVFSPLATAKALLNKRQMEIGVMLIDIGASTTSYVVYEDGELATCGVIPIGSMHITNDIAIGLRTNLELAEHIKIKYGYAMPDRLDDKDEIDLSKLDKNEEGKTTLKYISQIIEARLNEIFALIRDSLIRSDCNTALPAGVIVTGGGAKIGGIIEMIKENLRLPAQIGKPAIELSGLIDKLDDPIYSTSIGLMLWGKDSQRASISSNFDMANINGVVDKFKSMFKNILP